MIDTGSPDTITAFDEMKKTIKRDNLQVREMIKGERYVAIKAALQRKLLQLLG